MEGQLLQGPDRRRKEFLQAVRVFCEMIGGFRALHFVGPCVTVFGSARTPEDSPFYRLGMEVGGALAEAGFTVMTGGGPGIMEAASRGAKEAAGAPSAARYASREKRTPTRTWTPARSSTTSSSAR